MAVKAIKPHLSLGNIAFLSDAGIILAGGILFRDMDGVIYGMIVNYIFAIVVAQRTAPRRKSDRLRKPRNPVYITLAVQEAARKPTRSANSAAGMVYRVFRIPAAPK